MDKKYFILVLFLLSCSDKKKSPSPIIPIQQPSYNHKEVSSTNASSSSVVVLGASPVVRTSLCGNNVIDNQEICDDGNRLNGDGCSFDCKYEFPLCKWQCSSPACDVTCDPVCEPPSCHTACEPLGQLENCVCDVKCEKPECEIKCSEPDCEVGNCPSCVTICKQPHCVTHCQAINPGPHCTAPKPNCKAVCNEASCDYRCRFTGCEETPTCELFCEEPYPLCELK